MSGCYVAFHKQLGDLVLLEPALSRLREHYGEPVRVLTRNGHAPVLKLMHGVQLMHGMPLVPCRYLYCFDPLSKSAFRSLFTPALSKGLLIPEKRELRWYHPWIFSTIETPELDDTYIAEFFWSHLPVPAQHAFCPPRLDPPPEKWAMPHCKPGSYVLVHPTSGWCRKTWTVKGWVDVLRELEQAGPFIMTGGKIDWQIAHCQEIAEQAGSCVKNLVNATTMEEYLWLCANARAVLTVDGATSHLAAAFGVPCLTLFGPTSIYNWHRPAPRHRAIQAPVDKDGIRRLRRLEAPAVLETVRALLAE